MIIEGGITQRCRKEESDRMRHIEGTEGGSREIEGITREEIIVVRESRTT